jgi:hypothetical protein
MRFNYTMMLREVEEKALWFSAERMSTLDSSTFNHMESSLLSASFYQIPQK